MFVEPRLPVEKILLVLAILQPGFSRSELEDLMAAHHGRLLAILRFKTRDDHLAHDLAQETWLAFLAAAPAKRRFPTETSLRNYLITTALNKLRDHYRRHQIRLRRVHSFGSQEALDDCIANLESPLAGPEATLVETDQQAQLQRCVDLAMSQLKPIHHQILVLKFQEGLENPILADRLELGIKAIESLVVRAKQAFRKNLEKIALRENVLLPGDVD